MKKNLNDLGHRLLFSLGAAVIVTALVFFSWNPWVNGCLVLTIAALAGVGVWEYGELAKAKGLTPAVPLMIAVAAAEVIAFYVSIAFPSLSKLALLIMVLGFISFFVAHFRSPAKALLHIAVELFGVCYLAIPLSFILVILHPSSLGGDDGRIWLFYLIAVTKSSDMGGYFIGRLFGKRALAPSLSPKKTIEGSVGGFVGAVFVSLLFAYFSKGSELFHLSIGRAISLGLLIALLGQLGDLGESLLKRDAKVKDSNNLPGLGGVLDLLDSLLFTAPVVYFFVRI